ncbi:MAG: peptidoglycan-binding domain-containing protein [Candidatus Omnitrophota bacterium]
MVKVILGFLIISLVMFGCGKKQAQEGEQVVVTEADNFTSSQSVAEPEVVEMPAQAKPQEQVQVAQEDSSSQATAFVKPAIKDIQQALQNAGFDVTVDGKMGPKTKQAIKNFQEKNGLKVDGKVGPQTWEKLQRNLNTAEQ